MTYEKFPNQTGQNFPVPPQYATHPGTAVGFPAAPQYDTFPSGSATPLSIFGGSASVLQWVRADMGITLNGTDVSAWADQSGNGHHYAQAVAASQPPFNSAGGPNNLPYIGSVRANSDRLENTSLILPAPGTTPTTILMVMRQDAWFANASIIGDQTGASHRLVQNTATPGVAQNGGAVANLNNAGVLASWFSWIASFTNSAADSLKIGGGAAVTGANAGNTAGATGRQLFANAAAGHVSVSLGEVVYLNKVPSAGELTAWAAYVTAFWGATVGV